MSIWLDNSNNANVLENSYLEGFLDISGGAIQTRNATDHLLVAGDVSFNQVYVEPKIIENFNALISKDSSGVVFSNINPTQYAYDISGAASDGLAGTSVATSADGSIVAIGAPENAGGGTKRGEVRVYQKNNNSWLQLGSDLNGAADNDEFGYSLNLNGDGDILSVGTKNASNKTIVYKYASGSWSQYGNTIENNVSYINSTTTTVSTTWGQQVGNTFEDPNYNDYGGYCTKLSSDGNIFASACPFDSAGEVFIYQRDESNTTVAPLGWTQLGDMISGETSGDQAGKVFDLNDDGSIIAIGAGQDDGFSSNAGHIRVFQYSTPGQTGGSWSQIGGSIEGNLGSAYFGLGCAINSAGNIVIGGGPNHNSNTGSIAIYQRDESNTTVDPLGWTQLGDWIYGDYTGDYFGNSVAISDDGSIVAAGAYGHDSKGQVKVYQYSTPGQTGGSWSQMGPDIEGDTSSVEYGRTIAMNGDGTVIAFGAVNYSSNQGAVLVKKWNGSGWSSYGSRISGSSGYYLSGYSGCGIALNNDASVMIIGARNANSNMGRAYVYQYSTPGQTGGSWSELNYLEGGATNDMLGESVGISSSGHRIIIGASQAGNSGETYVYETGIDGIETVTFNTLSASTKSKLNKTGDKLTILSERHYDYNSYGDGEVQSYEYSASDTSWNYLGNKIESVAYNDISGGVVDINQAGDTIAIGYPKGASSSYSYTITADSGLYVVDGVNNPTLTMYRGAAYTLSINASGHPFHMQTTDNGGAYDSANLYTVATGSGTDNGTISFTLPNDAPNTLYYRCQYHSGMGNTISVEDDPGYTKVYKYDSSWNQVGSNITGGTTIAMDGTGDNVSIGYSYANSDAGKVKVYQNISDTWTQVGNDIEGASAGDKFGSSLDMDKAGTIVAVGATNANSGTGSAYVYQRDTSWNQIGGDLSGTDADGLTGTSVALNELGTEVTIGEPKSNQESYYITFSKASQKTLDWDFLIDSTTSVTDSVSGIVGTYNVGASSTQRSTLGVSDSTEGFRRDTNGGTSYTSTTGAYVAAETEVSHEGNPNFHYEIYLNPSDSMPLSFYGFSPICYLSNSQTDGTGFYYVRVSSNGSNFDLIYCDNTGTTQYTLSTTNPVGGNSSASHMIFSFYGTATSLGFKATVDGNVGTTVYAGNGFGIENRFDTKWLCIGDLHNHTSPPSVYMRATARAIRFFRIYGFALSDAELIELYNIREQVVDIMGGARTFTLGDHTEIFKNHVYRNTYSGVHIGTTEEYKSSVDYDTSLDVSGNVDVSGTIILAGDTSLNSTTLINNNLTVDGTTAYKTSVSNVTFTEDVSINQVIKTNTSDNTVTASSLSIHKDLSNNENFNYDNYLQVAGNVLVIDASNTNYGSYTVFAENPKGFTETSNSFIAGKSPTNVFNIVNDSNVGVYMNTGSNTFTGTSDANLKKNISEMDDTTKALQELKPCKYNWKTEEDDKEKHAGFIAQEVEKVYPELVEENVYPDGSKYKGVNTSKLIPYMIKEMKELKKEIEELS